jgi:ABC-type nitrate/sulfonate/bicarbonate transport system substrate-binding protein
MKKLINSGICSIIIIAASFLCFAPDNTAALDGQSIRIAYPIETLINGHVGQVLLKTDILEKNGLKGQITNFLYSGTAMQDLISDKTDVVFTSEIPAIKALSKGLRATIIATFGSLGRTGVIVLGDSSVLNIRDLKNRKIGVMFDSTAYHNLVKMLKAAGLVPDKNVTVLNVERNELSRVLLKKQVDAIAVLEPGVDYYIRKNKCRLLQDIQYFSVIIMSDSFIKQNPKAAINFINALKEAIFFMATHKGLVNRWFADESGFDLETINSCAEFNVNYINAKEISDVDIALNKNFLIMLKKNADFAFALKTTPNKVEINRAIKPLLETEAKKKIKKSSYNASAVIVFND